MPYLETRNMKIYYKEYGRGEPIVFLSGVAMSTNSWSPFIKSVTKNYKMIVVDLMDQGKTQGFEDDYTIETQADVLKEFLNNINVLKVHLVGMSYGGKVALTFALKYMDMVNSLSLVNTDGYTTKYNQELARSWVLAAATLNGELFSSVLLPSMYSISYYENNFEKMKEKENYFIKILSKDWYERFYRIILSSKSYNIQDKIHEINVPTLIITSDEDKTIPKKSQEIVHQKIRNSKWIIIKDTGHAIMYEKPQEFIEDVLNFIENVK